MNLLNDIEITSDCIIVKEQMVKSQLVFFLLPNSINDPYDELSYGYRNSPEKKNQLQSQ